MALIILRCAFVLVAAGMSVSFINAGFVPKDYPSLVWAFLGGLVLLALVVIGADVAVRRKRLETITAVYFGMIVGLILDVCLGISHVDFYRPGVQVS